MLVNHFGKLRSDGGEYQCTLYSYFKCTRLHIIENTQDEKTSHIIDIYIVAQR